jgi:arabinofuranosyltransferase
LNKKEVTALLFVAGGALTLLITGWRLFWFLCDDAFISFRYISNSFHGHGYVWNPPPFEPVEGYTNFLWVVLLDLVWRITGASPPLSSNVLSLIFSALTLVLGGMMLWRIEWADHLRKYRIVFLGLALLGVLTNRTFIAWTSSGLETAMFSTLILLWVSSVFRLHVAPRHLTGGLMSLAASLAALTRPDGLLFCVATVFIWLYVCRACRLKFTGKLLLPLAPLVMVIAHLVWRQWFYHDWLPNTYYAKFSGMWPESGVRYALSFILEYAIWFWLVVIIWTVVHEIRNGYTGTTSTPKNQPGNSFGRSPACFDSVLKRGVRMIAIGALLLHAGYYIFAVGGDHFEYRIFSHLIVLIWISMAWALNRLRLGLQSIIGMLIVFLILSLPVPWTHWAVSRTLETREETYQMHVPVAPHWPKAVRWYAQTFDQMQAWLISHLVCCRHQEHKIAYAWWSGTQIPTREEGKNIPSDSYPVMVAHGGIGALGWALPEVNLIDLHGLNDYVIARSPATPKDVRLMAHDRVPPAEYVDAFRPNVTFGKPGTIIMQPREKPLSAKDITSIEREWRQRVRQYDR